MFVSFRSVSCDRSGLISRFHFRLPVGTCLRSISPDPRFLTSRADLHTVDSMLEPVARFWGRINPFCDARLSPNAWCHSSQIEGVVQYLVVCNAAVRFWGLPCTPVFVANLLSITASGIAIVARYAR
jgi:hypothetical protein